MGDTAMNYEVNLGEGETLNITITSEGIIMDHYKNDDVSSTVGMMFDEWIEWMEK